MRFWSDLGFARKNYILHDFVIRNSSKASVHIMRFGFPCDNLGLKLDLFPTDENNNRSEKSGLLIPAQAVTCFCSSKVVDTG